MGLMDWTTKAKRTRDALEIRIKDLETKALIEKQENCHHRYVFEQESKTMRRPHWKAECSVCKIERKFTEFDVIKELARRNQIEIYQELPKHDSGYPYAYKHLMVELK